MQINELGKILSVCAMKSSVSIKIYIFLFNIPIVYGIKIYICLFNIPTVYSIKISVYSAL